MLGIRAGKGRHRRFVACKRSAEVTNPLPSASHERSVFSILPPWKPSPASLAKPTGVISVAIGSQGWEIELDQAASAEPKTRRLGGRIKSVCP